MTTSDPHTSPLIRSEVFLLAGIATGVALCGFALRSYGLAFTALAIAAGIAVFIGWKWRGRSQTPGLGRQSAATADSDSHPADDGPVVPRSVQDFTAITHDVAAIARGESVDSRIDTAGRAARHAVATVQEYVGKQQGQSVFFSIERTKYGANLKSVVHAGGSDDAPGIIPRHTPLGGFLWDAMAARETVYFADLTEGQPQGWQPWSAQRDEDVPPARSLLIAPVCGPGHGIGIMWVESPSVDAFNRQDQMTLEVMRNLVESTFGLVETPETRTSKPGVAPKPEQIDLTPTTSPTPIVTAAVESATLRHS